MIIKPLYTTFILNAGTLWQNRRLLPHCTSIIALREVEVASSCDAFSVESTVLPQTNLHAQADGFPKQLPCSNSLGIP